MPSELIDEDHSSHVCPRARAQRMRFSTKSRTATGLTYSLSLLGLSQGLFEVTNINVGKGVGDFMHMINSWKHSRL